MRDTKLWIFALATTLALACGDDGGTGDTGGTPTTDDSGTTSQSSTSTDGSGSGPADSTGVGSTGGLCVTEFPAIVTDIDETLTLSDAEFIMQIGDGNYDPVEREGAAELIGAYAALGYHVVYLTARSEQIMVEITEETAREATERWLDEHGFPLDPDTTTVILAPEFLLGEDVHLYKAGALMEQQAAGLRFDYAYGNADTDISAYAEAGIPLDATFIIGEHAGEGGTVAVAGEGWVEHTEAHLPGVPAACEGG